MSNNALVFFTDSSYLKGFKILYKSIKENNLKLLNSVDKILFVDSSVDTKKIDDISDFKIKKINTDDYSNIILDDRFPYWHKTFFKLDIFGILGYDRLVFIESDILCVGDISYLFNLESNAEIIGVNHVNNKWLSPAVLVINKTFVKRDAKSILIERAKSFC